MSSAILGFVLATICGLSKLASGTNGDLCARTSLTEVDRQPWWQVDLGRDYVIDGIDITTNDEIADFNNHAESYFIGASTRADMEFKYICEGRSYYKFPSWPPKTSIVCKEPMLGRYVVIKKLKACENMGSCPLSHLPLSLCEVEVQGYRFQFDREKAVNIAYKALVRQSGTVNDASLAVDGNFIIEPIQTHKPQCAIITSKQLSGTIVLKPEWCVYFSTPQIVDRVVIYTNESSKNLSVILELPLSNEEFSCFPEGQAEDSVGITFLCSGDQKAQKVYVKLTYPGSLVLCEVEVFTSENTGLKINIALGKPTNQSSIEYDAVSDLAVDGHISSQFYPAHGQWIAQCTHTKEVGDTYPWWQVDLLQEYIVTNLNIYNRGESLHSRLHDIEIRIGNFDIINFIEREDYRFRKNPLCFSKPNSYLNGGQNAVRCQQELVGRYVTVQIVKLCTVVGCHWTAQERNILTLCEVEVYGDEIVRDTLKEQNVAVSRSVQHSLDIEDDAEVPLLAIGLPAVLADDHPWFLVDLISKTVVDRIVIITDGGDIGLSPDFDIRVGNEMISAEYNNKIFKKNIICYRMSNGFFIRGKHEFKCSHPLVGKYLSLQITENCTTDSCLAKYQPFLSADNVEVWGYFYHNIKTSKNIALHALTDKEGTVIGNASLAVDGIFPKSVFETETIDVCAQTVSSYKNPWFQVRLETLSLVDSISIILPGLHENEKFHDIEIRVGFSDIAEMDMDDPYAENALCFKSDNGTYLEGNNTFHCTLPLIGTFVSIQIVNLRYIQRVDPVKSLLSIEEEKNVLHLCEVQIWGYPPPSNVQIENLSFKKKAEQSSINEDDYPSLANDGVSPLGMISKVHFTSCFEGADLQCSVDTSRLRDCSEIQEKGCTKSGVYILSYVNEDMERIFFNAYCDMDTDGGGWTVFQRRNISLSRQVKFSRGWDAYKNGFGNLCGEYWLGNNFIHYFGTKLEMRIDLTAEGESKVMQFDTFSIDNEENNYTVHAEYLHENTDIQIESINGQPFQTYDRNSRKGDVEGGWWFAEKGKSFNLNGEDAMLILFPPNILQLFSYSEMKLRPTAFSYKRNLN